MKTVTTFLLVSLLLVDGICITRSIANEDGIVKNGKSGGVLPIDKSHTDGSMVFKHFIEGRGIWGNWIYAEGTIVSSTPRDFMKLVKTVTPPSKIIILNSNGGNLFAAIKLGEIFRSMGATVKVGKTIYNENGFNQADDPDAGVCFSACAYAFLGGLIREVPAQSKYGVHQFFSEDISGFAAAQGITSILLKYIGKMGVDSGLLELASRFSPGNPIYILDRRTLVSLQVDNTEPLYEDWALEPFRAGAIATIRQKPEMINNVINAASIYCSKDGAGSVVLVLTKPMSQATFNDMIDIQKYITLYVKIGDMNKEYEPAYSLENQPDNSHVLHVSMELDSKHQEYLFNGSAQNILVKNEGPTVTWGYLFRANFQINNKSRKVIGLALSNCIDSTTQ